MIEHTVMCDVCGVISNEIDCLEFIHIDHTFGFGSKYDGSKMAIDMCEKCFDENILSKISDKQKEDIITEIPF
jgi:hypothetical protein